MHLGRPHDRPARDVAQREVPRRVQIDDISLYQVQPLIPEYVYPQARVVSQATDQELPADLIGCEEREQCSKGHRGYLEGGRLCFLARTRRRIAAAEEAPAWSFVRDFYLWICF